MSPLMAFGFLPKLHNVAGANIAQLASLVSTRAYAQLTLVNKGTTVGPGGRSSNTGLTTTVFGANGFVGSYVANEVAKPGTRIVCPYRCPEEKAIHLKQMGDLGQVVMLREFDIRDDASVKYAISRSQVIINMIGSRVETMNWSFDMTHNEWPARLAKIAAASPQVERLIHFSDMGAHPKHPSSRMRSKALGDAAVMEAFPKANIIKPGPVIGIEDHFFNYIVYQLKYGTLAPVFDSGVTKIQPTHVDDVAKAVVKILSSPDMAGKEYTLGGPEVLTMREVYDMISSTLRLMEDNSTNIPSWAAKLLFKPKELFARFLPELPLTSYMFTTDYVNEMSVDKVVPKAALGYTDLDIIPARVTDGIAIEPVRHMREGGYEWGDVEAVAQHVPDHIRRYFQLETKRKIVAK